MRKNNKEAEFVIKEVDQYVYLLKWNGSAFLFGIIAAPFLLPERTGLYIYCYGSLSIGTLYYIYQYITTDKTNLIIAMDKTGVRMAGCDKLKSFTWTQVKSIRLHAHVVSRDRLRYYIYVESAWSKDYRVEIPSESIVSVRKTTCQIQEVIQKYAGDSCTFSCDIPSFWESFKNRKSKE